MHFHPLKVISDLWVSFPGRMITVFYGGGERSDGLMPLGERLGSEGRQGHCCLFADTGSCSPSQERRRLTLSLSRFLFLFLSPPSITHFFSPSLTGTVSFKFLQRTHTHAQAHTHTYTRARSIYLSKTPLPTPNPPPQRNSFQLCRHLKKPLYAEQT